MVTSLQLIALIKYLGLLPYPHETAAVQGHECLNWAALTETRAREILLLDSFHLLHLFLDQFHFLTPLWKVQELVAYIFILYCIPTCSCFTNNDSEWKIIYGSLNGLSKRVWICIWSYKVLSVHHMLVGLHSI